MPSDDFDNVKKLLALKRHEQPPPGYFESFSDSIIATLKADRLRKSQSLWERLLEHFDAKPALACVYGVAVSSLLLTGFYAAQAFEDQPVAAIPVSPNWLAVSPALRLVPSAGADVSVTFDALPLPAAPVRSALQAEPAAYRMRADNRYMPAQRASFQLP